MRKFVFFVAFLFAGATAVQAQAKDCSTIKSAKARLACYDGQKKPGNSAAKRTLGKVQGVITWQYNNFVGTKGDVGATVVLIPAPVEETIKKLSGPELGLLSLGMAPGQVEKYGIYSADADGFGNFSIDGVPTGSYQVFVFSSKTSPGPDDYMTNRCQTEYAKYFAGHPEYKDLAFKVHKVYCTSATVSEGQTTTISHDFGNTYI